MVGDNVRFDSMLESHFTNSVYSNTFNSKKMINTTNYNYHIIFNFKDKDKRDVSSISFNTQDLWFPISPVTTRLNFALEFVQSFYQTLDQLLETK